MVVGRFNEFKFYIVRIGFRLFTKHRPLDPPCGEHLSSRMAYTWILWRKTNQHHMSSYLKKQHAKALVCFFCLSVSPREKLGGDFKYVLFSYLGKWCNLTIIIIFQMGWFNHQLGNVFLPSERTGSISQGRRKQIINRRPPRDLQVSRATEEGFKLLV